MIPIYILSVLVATGYYLSKNSLKQAPGGDEPVYPVADEPSGRSIYDSNKSREVEAELYGRANTQFEKSQEPYNTGVISQNYRANEEASTRVTSRLAGVDIPKEEFVHNNMMPFFGGSIKQSLNENAASHLLAAQTGVDGLQFGKREVETFSDKSPDLGNVYGMSGTYQLEQDRMVQSRNRNNEQPTPMQVGPGLGLGYGSTPSGGFQQLEVQRYAQQKSVDELRTVAKPNPSFNDIGMSTNQKASYEGRTVDGQGVKMGAQDVGAFAKNRVDTYFENAPDRYFTTVGAVTKEGERPDQLVKCTARSVTANEEYQGGAYANRAMEERPDTRDPMRQCLEEFGVRNAEAVTKASGACDDYSRTGYKTYTNARDVTACRTYEGNLMTAVKSWVAPFTDAARSTTKEYTVSASRPYGMMSVRIPAKLTIYDPNDVAKTTIKETLIHDEHAPNIKGATLLTVYDPDDIARVTTRETLPGTDPNVNIARVSKKGKAYDPNDVARTTTKETLIEDGHQGGPSTTQAGNAYITTEWDAKLTHKQFLSDREYEGGVHQGALTSGAYKGERYDVKATQKQFTADNDYYGTGKTAGGGDQPMSQADADNAVINHTKELLENARAPTQTGVKLSSGGETVNMGIVKRDSAAVAAGRMFNNPDHVRSAPPSKAALMDVTKNHKSYVDDARLDPSILDAYKKNPYTHSLSSTY
jgi:hypothetical protein